MSDHEDRAELVLAILKGFAIVVMGGGLLWLLSM